MSNLKATIAYQIEKAWYGKTGLTLLLRPFSWLFISLVHLRRLLYRAGILRSHKPAVPVIIVGNLTVGGTGKTPLVIWIANYLKAAGFKPGIISRGYGGRAKKWPQQVRPDADPFIVGDEALVVSRQTGCPMAVGPNRVDDINALLKYSHVDVIVSDDGLQHYALRRDIEIAVIDGIRRFGNGYCLPAGPLRERPSRLDEVDYKVTNGVAAQGEYDMRYQGEVAVNLVSRQERPLTEFRDQTVNAVAGIGNPDRFFNYLRSRGLRLNVRAFPDHHPFVADDLSFAAAGVVFMTEKDAVKCQRFAHENCWYVPVRVKMSEEFGTQLISLLEERHG